MFGPMEGDHSLKYTDPFCVHFCILQELQSVTGITITSARQLMRTVEDLGHLTQLQKAGVSTTGVAAHDPARFECVESYDSCRRSDKSLRRRDSPAAK